MAVTAVMRVLRVPVMVMAVVTAGTVDVLGVERRIGDRHACCSWD
jgi:hypothetical protein